MRKNSSCRWKFIGDFANRLDLGFWEVLVFDSQSISECDSPYLGGRGGDGQPPQLLMIGSCGVCQWSEGETIVIKIIIYRALRTTEYS